MKNLKRTIAQNIAQNVDDGLGYILLKHNAYTADLAEELAEYFVEELADRLKNEVTV